MFSEVRPKTKTVNFMLLDGGLGDHVAALTAVNYILKYDWITPLIWVPDFMKEISMNLLPEGTQIFGYSDMRGRYEPKKTTKSTKWDGHTSPMKIHLLDYAFLKLCDENPSIEHKNYLPLKRDRISLERFNLPERFVAVTCGFTAEVREFPAKSINGITNWLNQRGYTPVFLGNSNVKTGARHIIEGKFSEEIDFSQGIDLIDKTKLTEAAAIIYDSAAVIGVDNGLLHIAGMTETPIVGGFTTVRADVRWPVRHNELGWNCYSVLPDASLDCAYCQSDTNFLYSHKYTDCWFKNQKGFEDRVNLCTRQMSSDKFISILDKILP